MKFLHSRKSYDRARIMRQAAGARRRRRPRKAIALYRQVLEVEPNNFDIHRRVAPLLMRIKQFAESKASYVKAAEGLTQQGFEEQATGVYREAVRELPPDVDLCLALSEMQVKRGRAADAVGTLLEGRRRFRRRRDRPRAIRLLHRAHKLDPHRFEIGFDLARLLARVGARDRAGRLLAQLSSQASGGRLRRVRTWQLRLRPTPSNAWRWLCALVRGH